MIRVFFREGTLLLLFMLFLPSPTWGYRPFISTDAAVAGLKEMEIELGYLNLERTEGENTLIIPQLVVNYGIARNLEVVGEFEVEKPLDEDLELVDPALSLKTVLREGILQEKNGVSIAIETSLLLPSTVQGERKFGFETMGIFSEKLSPFIFHINIGGGVDRVETSPFAVWGLIVEFPVNSKFRLVGEVSGEGIREEVASNSGLLGFIWKSTRPNVFVDAGIRKGISGETLDWMFTTGLTFAFALPGVSPVKPSPSMRKVTHQGL